MVLMDAEVLSGKEGQSNSSTRDKKLGWRGFKKTACTIPNAGLLFLGVGLGTFAFFLGSTPAGPPPVPPSPSVEVVNIQPLPPSLEIVTKVQEISAHTVSMQVILQAIYPSAERVHWWVVVAGLTGAICSPRHDSGCTVPDMGPFHVGFVPYQAYWNVKGTSEVAGGPDEEGFAEIGANWTHDSPIRARGSYLSALLPMVTSTYCGTVVRELAIPESFFDYTLEGGESPSDSFGQGWVWSEPLCPESSSTGDYIPLSAVSISSEQRDAQRGFWAGVFWGLAGGALISVIGSVFAGVSQALANPIKQADDGHVVNDPGPG